MIKLTKPIKIEPNLGPKPDLNPKEEPKIVEIKKEQPSINEIKSGGKKLEFLSKETPKIVSSIDGLRLQKVALEEQIKDLGKISKDEKDKLEKRRLLKAQIKALELEINSIKIELKPEMTADSADKFNKLAKEIGYNGVDLKQLTKEKQESEKKNILTYADKQYTEPSKIASNVIIQFTHIADGFDNFKGYSSEIEKNRIALEDAVKKVLIQEGLNGNQATKIISNPYMYLGIVLGAPLIGVYLQNKSGQDKKKIVVEPILKK